MRILVDTNIIIDIFTKREPWFEDSYNSLLRTLEDKNNECLFSAAAVTDVYYILHKALHSDSKAREIIERLSRLVTITDVRSIDIQSAINSAVADFEDAVVDSVAKRHGASCILTRNDRDYVNSSVPALTPTVYMKKFLSTN